MPKSKVQEMQLLLSAFSTMLKGNDEDVKDVQELFEVTP
jgi:hypothetical protein